MGYIILIFGCRVFVFRLKYDLLGEIYVVSSD